VKKAAFGLSAVMVVRKPRRGRRPGAYPTAGHGFSGSRTRDGLELAWRIGSGGAEHNRRS